MSAEAHPAPIGLIWAQANGGVVGAAGAMPWHLPEDLAHFKAKTTGCPVVMGRRTWDAIDPRFRPLPERRNIVITRQPGWIGGGAEVAHSLDAAIALAAVGSPERIWVIGGAEVYRSAIDRADRLEVTEIDQRVDGDAFAPEIDDSWLRLAADPALGWHSSRTGIGYRFASYGRAGSL